MTDNTDALDELVSRYLDAEATADEVARVESDPELLDRADAMRASIEAVAAPVAIPTLDLDRIRAAAVAQSTTTAVVTDVMAARRRKLERRNRVMAVAAACVVLAVSVVAVQNLGGSDGDDSLDSATESTDAAFDGDDDMAEEESAFDLSTDDDMAEEADEDAAMAETEMFDGDDMAEADDMGGSDDMADEGEASTDTMDGGADIVGIDAMRSSVDELPGDLGEFDDDASLFAAVEAAYASVVAPDLAPNVVDGLCGEAADSIAFVQDDATRSVESAFAVIGGEPSVVLVAVTLDGQLDVFAHPEGACEAVRTVSQELP